MGRGKSWDSRENEALARAWVCASEDPITGTNQTSKTFAEALRCRFIKKGPSPPVPDVRYGNLNAASCKSHFDAISADAQKLYVSLRKVRACSPTGVTGDNIISMAVAIHVGKCIMMEYANKDFDKDTWSVYRAWKVLSTRPKWSQRVSRTHDCEAVNGAGHEQSDDVESVPESGSAGSDSGPGGASTVGTSNGANAPERFNIGSRNAKLVRQEEMRTNAVRSMAESAKRKSTALEERNAIAVFSRSEAQNIPETASFFRALRQTYLSQALKRARLADSEGIDASALTPVPTSSQISPPTTNGTSDTRPTIPYSSQRQS